MHKIKIVPFLFLILSFGPAQAQLQTSMLEQDKAQAEEDLVLVNNALVVEYAKEKNYDACKVVQLETEQAYDTWFIQNYSKFEALSSSLSSVIATASAKIETLKDQTVRVIAVKEQTTPEIEMNLETMINYFKLFNNRLLGCSKDLKQELIDQMEDPKRNKYHVAHSQVLIAMKAMTTNLNASLKQQDVSYEIAFKPVPCGYALELKVKLKVNEVKQKYDFSLLGSVDGAPLIKIMLDDDAKWSALSKNKIDGLPVDGMMRYRLIQDQKKGKCENLAKIPSYDSGFPFLTYPNLLALSAALKKEGKLDASPDMEFVTIKSAAYEMQTTEVTQKQWFQVMETNPSHFTQEKYCPETYADENGGMCPNNPVEQVSYEDITGANGFLAKLNAKKDGYTYRLPTVAEWVYAAKAGSTTEVSFGSGKTKLTDYAWYDKNSNGHTQEVATREKSAFELYDMQGNVWEWVQDGYGGDDSYPNRVACGGSWTHPAQYCMRPSCLTNWQPSSRVSHVGFRLVRQPQ